MLNLCRLFKRIIQIDLFCFECVVNTHSEQAQCCVISISVANVNIYKYVYRKKKKKAECDKIVDIFNLFLLSHVSLYALLYITSALLLLVSFL